VTLEFLWLLVWEFAQNLPLVVGFIVALERWQQGEEMIAIACMVAGSVAAALVIRVTEPKIFEGHCESMQAVIANVLTFSLLMLVLVIYLSTSWSRWWMDVAGGLIVAVVLAVVQDRVAKERFGAIRSLALGLSCSASLVFIRLLFKASSLINIVVVTVWFTLVMGIYKQLRSKSLTGELYSGQ
jgi:hypothetical protein